MKNPNVKTSHSKTLKFEDGAVQFRLRLVVSILSHRPLLLRNIRSDDVHNIGLQEHEASFLRLLDKMTNGSTIEINATGTQLRFKPGILLGGDIDHACPVSPPQTTTDSHSPTTASITRNVGWYLEGIIPLAPFGKEPLSLTMTGVTDGLSDMDPSPDYLATSILPVLLQFGVGTTSMHNSTPDPFSDESAPTMKVTRRGAAPRGVGEVVFTCPVVREISTSIDLTDEGKVKRVRGTVVSCRIPPSSAARVAHVAKGMLLRLLPDVWIHTDVHSSSSSKKGGVKVEGCGPSPSLSMCLAAESTTGVIISTEACLDSAGGAQGKQIPEDLGVKVASMLLYEIRKGGCVDTGAQSTAFLLMCLSPEDVARIRVGTLSQYAIATLRLIKKAFGLEFKVKADFENSTVLVSCLGTGYRNMAKASS